MIKIEWIDVNEKLPRFGDPVILLVNSTVQHITYFLDHSDADECYWFEPYLFESDDKLKITFSFSCEESIKWCYLDDLIDKTM